MSAPRDLVAEQREHVAAWLVRLAALGAHWAAVAAARGAR